MRWEAWVRVTHRKQLWGEQASSEAWVHSALKHGFLLPGFYLSQHFWCHLQVQWSLSWPRSLIPCHPKQGVSLPIPGECKRPSPSQPRLLDRFGEGLCPYCVPFSLAFAFDTAFRLIDVKSWKAMFATQQNTAISYSSHRMDAVDGRHSRGVLQKDITHCFPDLYCGRNWTTDRTFLEKTQHARVWILCSSVQPHGDGASTVHCKVWGLPIMKETSWSRSIRCEDDRSMLVWLWE